MIHRRFLLAFPLLVLGFLCSGALAQRPGDDLSRAERPGGPVGGLFDAAAPFRPGHMTGVMTTPEGRALFAIDVVVFPGGPFGRGVLLGRATHLVGPFAGRDVPLRGVWVAGDGGRGRFAAVLLHRSSHDDGFRLVPFIELGGGFLDRNGAPPPPGTFRGKWDPLP